MRKSILFALLLVAASTLTAYATQSDTESMTCGGDDYRLSTHDYASSPTDTLQPHHLELARPFTDSARLELHVCQADLRIRTRPDAKQLTLTVVLDTLSTRYAVVDYIRTIRVQPDRGVIQLKFPKEAHAIVTLTLPMGPNSENEINLGRGNLDFDAAQSTGSRQINVGMGHMQLTVDHDKNYATMEVNVGMGSLHDQRPGGSDGHFVVNREYTGAGSGSLEINVGMGSLDIRNN